MTSLQGVLTTETFAFSGGRSVTVYSPPVPPEAVVYAADGGWHTERLAQALEASTDGSSTMIVGVHGLDDDDERLHEYVEAFGRERFDAFEGFFVDQVRAWVTSAHDVEFAKARTAVWGASLGGELSLAVGLRNRRVYGAVMCASPGGGFTPASAELSSQTTPTYLVAGRQEPWFLENACGWAEALTECGADVVIEQCDGEHGGDFWYEAFPRMVSWSFTR